MSVVVQKACAVIADSGLVLVQCGASAATLEPDVAEKFSILLAEQATAARAQQAEGATGEPEHAGYDPAPSI